MKKIANQSRRQFLQSTGLAGLALSTGTVGRAFGFESPNSRPRIGVVGCGSRWDVKVTGSNAHWGNGKDFPKFGDISLLCDVELERIERAKELVKGWTGRVPEGTGDYRKVIDDKSIDIVHVVTPDHWHAKVAIEAMLAGKDVYCEKPMTLTIEEGRQICDVCRKTGRIFQVGTQQRSIPRMVKAIAMIRDGRLGEIRKVTCGLGGGPTSPEIPVADVPKDFDWDRWLGPAPMTEYLYLPGAQNELKAWERTHYEFRWWYEYSGGKLTDWGAHHVDIATWGIDKTDTGPVSIDPVMVEHPVEFKDGYPVVNNRYNTATRFVITATYADGVEMTIRDDKVNGVLFEGTKGRILVNRGRLTGKPVEDLASDPLPESAMEEAYKGRPLTDHTTNFFEAVANRKEPISDVYSHHRALSTCHLAGIAARLGRKITWDPEAEQIVGDPQAQALVARENRQGYEIEM